MSCTSTLRSAGVALELGPLSILLAAFLLVAATAPVAPATNPGWEKMKSLVGEWEGTMSHGDQSMPVKVSYSLVSSGTSLMRLPDA